MEQVHHHRIKRLLAIQTDCVVRFTRKEARLERCIDSLECDVEYCDVDCSDVDCSDFKRRELLRIHTTLSNFRHGVLKTV